MHLAIDTTTSKSLIALKSDGELIERQFEPKSTQKVIFSELANLLAPDILDGITAITVGLGPGSFTGVKIGVMAAKTLAWSRSIPIAGVCSLDAVAAGTPLPDDTDVNLVVAVPSTRGEAYIRIYRQDNDCWVPEGGIIDVRLVLSELESLIPLRKLIVSGEACRELVEIIKMKWICECPDVQFTTPRASGLFKLGEDKYSTGQTDDPLAITPMYIRPSQPERIEREKLS